jgi:hypothetical protein
MAVHTRRLRRDRVRVGAALVTVDARTVVGGVAADRELRLRIGLLVLAPRLRDGGRAAAEQLERGEAGQRRDCVAGAVTSA